MKSVWVVARTINLGYDIEGLYEHLMDVPYTIEPCYVYHYNGADKPLIKGKQLEDRYVTNDPNIFIFKQEIK